MNVGRVGIGSLVAICAVVLTSGCRNNELADVQGTVTLDGKPLPGGIIVFEPLDRMGATSGGEIVTGQYQLTGSAGVPAGEKTVRITGIYKTGRQIEVGPPAPKGTKDDEIREIDLPEIYNERSTLQCQIVAGETNKHDFSLKSH